MSAHIVALMNLLKVVAEFGFGPGDEDRLYRALEESRVIKKHMKSLALNFHDVLEGGELIYHQRNNRMLGDD